MEKHFEIIPYKDGFVVVETKRLAEGQYTHDRTDFIAATSNLNLDVPVIDWPEESKSWVDVVTDLHNNHGYFQGDNWKVLERLIKEEQKYKFTEEDMKKAMEMYLEDSSLLYKTVFQSLSKPKIPKGVWLECEEYIDAEEEIKTGKMWNPKLQVLTKDNKVIPVRWEY